MTGGEAIAVIVNPAAGWGRGARIWDDMAARLAARQMPYVVCFTRGPTDATALTAAALRDGARTVVSVGGDGTAHEVVNGFFEGGTLINPQARVAFVAAGTGNDVGRELRFHEEVLLREHAQCIDLLRIRHAASDASERYALLHAGVGLASEVVEASNRLKRRLGKLVYAGGSTVALLRHRPSALRYSYDGGLPENELVNLLVATNGKYAGGGMMISPPASMQDGLMDVVTMRGASRPAMLFRLLPAVYRGAHLGHPAIRHIQTRAIFIDSDTPLPLEIDGELAGTTPVSIEVLPNALSVCMPPAR